MPPKGTNCGLGFQKFFNLKFNFYLRSLNFGPFQRHTDEFETYICRDGTKRDYEIKIYE